MLRGGYLTAGHWRGSPIRVHWLTPLGALFFGGFTWAPAFWASFLLLILVHELGHAFVARRAGASVLAIDVLPIGGLCTWSGEVSPFQRACIAWGGVWAQALLLLATVVATRLHGAPETRSWAQVEHAFTTTNLYLMALNLLPVPPLDGAKAWALVPMLVRRASARGRGWRLEREAQLDALEAKVVAPAPEVRAMVDGLFAELRSRTVELPVGGTHLSAHSHSTRHRDEVMTSLVCGCFHCVATFPPSSIREWIDAAPGEEGQTALCPRCGIDAVIGSRSGYPVEPAFLERMKAYWF